MSGRTPGLLIATDLDGCLLDGTTYSFDAAGPALAGPLGPIAALIVENSGAIVLPGGPAAAAGAAGRSASRIAT